MLKLLRKLKRLFPHVSVNQNDFYLQMLAKHQRTFRCAVCDRPSSGPILIGNSDDRLEISSFSGVIAGFDEQEDWETPRDLQQCNRCGLFYCLDHIRGNSCLRCQGKI